MNRSLQRALLAIYRAATAVGLLKRGPGRRAVEVAYLGYKRLFEAGSPKRLLPYVEAGSTVIDVGANIGFFTLPFARWVGPQGRVIALEPEDLNHRRLAARLAAAGLSDRVALYEAAAAEESGRQRLAVNPDHPGDHKLATEGAENSVEIDAFALDDLIAENPGPTVSLVKIDVQGAELRVIKGAHGLIERDRPALLVEIDPGASDADGSPAARIVLSLLVGLGYEFRPWTRRGAGKPQDLEAIVEAAKAVGYLDVLCVSAADRAASRALVQVAGRR